jgi:hypothetical protein
MRTIRQRRVLLSDCACARIITLKRCVLVDVGVSLKLLSAIVLNTVRQSAFAPQNSGDGAVCRNYSQRDGG